MDTSQQAGDSRPLYRFLRLGVTILPVVFFVIHYMNGRPMLSADTSPFVRYLPSAVSVVMMAAGLLVLMPRVPARHLGQTLDQYWTSQDSAGAANLLWFVLEAGAILGAIGYFLAGDVASAAVMVAGVGVFWFSGPDRFGRT